MCPFANNHDRHELLSNPGHNSTAPQFGRRDANESKLRALAATCDRFTIPFVLKKCRRKLTAAVTHCAAKSPRWRNARSHAAALRCAGDGAGCAAGHFITLEAYQSSNYKLSGHMLLLAANWRVKHAQITLSSNCVLILDYIYTYKYSNKLEQW